jgi:FSR family fosmidomycin resistance protein-like MFS transporter
MALYGTHSVIDIYAALVPPLIGVLQVRCEMTRGQAAWLLGIGSISSGLAQPICAWLSDRMDSRMFGALGLVLAAACLCAIGLADSFATLVPLYVVGMIGSGVFHPIAASSVGQLADQLGGRGRAAGISWFYASGMVGSIIGALIAREVAGSGDRGFNWLMTAMIPGLALAWVLHRAIRNVGHRHVHHRTVRFTDGERAARWFMIGLLWLGNAMRFSVNMALVYLLVRWAEAHVASGNAALSAEEVAHSGGEIAAVLNAWLVAGLGFGGLVAGRLIRPGHEKWPLVLVPILLAPAIAFMGQPIGWLNSVLAVLAGMGFSAIIPITLGLAQRLLPHRTSLASGLMLGGAWALAIAGPRAAEWCLSDLGLSLRESFIWTAGLLAISGLVSLPLRTRVLKATIGPPG